MASNHCGFVSEDDTYSCSKEIDTGNEYCIWHRPSDKKSVDEIINRLDEGESPPKESRLRDLQFEDHIFEGIDFEGVDFESTRFRNVEFQSCNLDYARFYDVVLKNVDFLDCVLSGATFSGTAEVRDSLFKGGKNEGFEMKSIRCEKTDFVSFEISEGSFYDTIIFGGECRQFIVRDSNLNLLEFRRVELQNCTFDAEQAKPLEFDGGSITSTSIMNRQRGSFRFLGLDTLHLILKGNGEADVEIQNCSEATVDCRMEDLGLLQATAVEGERISIRNGDIDEFELNDVTLDHLRLDSIEAAECLLNEINVNHRGDLEAVILNEGRMDSISLPTAQFEDTKFESVDSDKFHIDEGQFDGVAFSDGRYKRARFPDVVIEDCEYRNVEFERGTHRGAVIDADTEFENASFEQVDLERAALNGLDLNDTSLERAILRGCDFRTASLSRVRLYDAHLLDVRLNEATDFGEKCIYENEVDNKVGGSFDEIGIHALDRLLGGVLRLMILWNSTQIGELDIENSLEKAVRVYSDYQRILRENSIRNDIRQYRVRERDVQRKLALARGKRRRWFRLMIERWSMKYGEGAKNMISTSIVIIFIWTFFYMISGGLKVVEANGPTMTTADSNPVTQAIGWILTIIPLSSESVMTFTRNFYFSIVTFTTLGFGDIQPATQASRYLAAIESFLGAVLMALLVYVLGRRATW